MHWFLSLDDAYEKIGGWVSEYNHFRPHSSLNDQTPAAVVEQYKGSSQSLPAAPLSKAMYFAATEYPSTVSENTYLYEEGLTPSNSPESPN
jgi:putative transposase